MGRLSEAVAVMNDAATTELAHIEYRIELHMRGAYENILEVGRCLIEAKESRLVTHGEWEAWVRRNTQMSERQAQRLMRVARNVLPGSAMERLPISKIQAILTLPDFEREPMAERAAENDMSLREVQAAVKGVELGTRSELQVTRGTGDRDAREIDRLKAELARALAMREMADMMRATNERMGELERQVRLLTKVTPLQAGEVNAAIRRRASALCAAYGIMGRETVVGNAIRRDVKLTQGVGNMRELPRCEYAAVIRQVGIWDDYLVMSSSLQVTRGTGG
jgi:hypothetical protein